MCRYLSDDLASWFSAWLVKLADNTNPYQAAFVMESILNHYNLSTFSFCPSSLSSDTKDLACETEINALTLSQQLPGLCLKSACSHSSSSLWVSQVSVSAFWGLSGRLLGLLLHKHLAAVCAICAFSQQVITNRRFTSHSVQLDCDCWHGQGQLSEGAGWQQLDSTHLWSEGKGCNEEKICAGKNKCLLALLAVLAVSTCVILSFLVLNI